MSSVQTSRNNPLQVIWIEDRTAAPLIHAGLGAQEAIDFTRRCRPGAVEGKQPEFVRQYGETQRS